MFGFDEGVDDEYVINEIIGIDEFTYEDFVKDKEVKKPALRQEFKYDE